MTGVTLLQFVRNRAGVSWLILIAATLISWMLGVEHGVNSTIAVVVLAIAAVKIRLVGLDFMGLRHAPIPLRAVFEAYCLTLWVLLSALYQLL